MSQLLDLASPETQGLLPKVSPDLSGTAVPFESLVMRFRHYPADAGGMPQLPLEPDKSLIALHRAAWYVYARLGSPFTSAVVQSFVNLTRVYWRYADNQEFWNDVGLDLFRFARSEPDLKEIASHIDQICAHLAGEHQNTETLTQERYLEAVIRMLRPTLPHVLRDEDLLEALRKLEYEAIQRLSGASQNDPYRILSGLESSRRLGSNAAYSALLGIAVQRRVFSVLLMYGEETYRVVVGAKGFQVDACLALLDKNWRLALPARCSPYPEMPLDELPTRLALPALPPGKGEAS